jgi:hypothetical protein
LFFSPLSFLIQNKKKIIKSGLKVKKFSESRRAKEKRTKTDFHFIRRRSL